MAEEDRYKRKFRYLGLFTNLNDVVCIRNEAEKEYFKGFLVLYNTNTRYKREKTYMCLGGVEMQRVCMDQKSKADKSMKNDSKNTEGLPTVTIVITENGKTTAEVFTSNNTGAANDYLEDIFPGLF